MEKLNSYSMLFIGKICFYLHDSNCMKYYLEKNVVCIGFNLDVFPLHISMVNIDTSMLTDTLMKMLTHTHRCTFKLRWAPRPRILTKQGSMKLKLFLAIACHSKYSEAP